MSKCPYEPGKLYEIYLGSVPEVWKEAYYVGLDGDGDITFHVKDRHQYESFDWAPHRNPGCCYVREIKKPRKISGWVNIYGDKVGGFIFETKDEADSLNRNHHRIACIYVSGEEGKEP